MAFTHLHLHTEYSLLDGCCRINSLFNAVKDAGQNAVAITDHGVMYGVIDFYKAAKSNGIKPIIGCEVYVAPRSRFDKDKNLDGKYGHLVLLCENNEGYSNLIKMVSSAFTEGFYSKPRVDRDLLKKYSKGIIALSACLAGEIPQALLENDYQKAKDIALWYKETFGKDNYFIELQNHGIAEQRKILPLLTKLAEDVGVGTVATNDVHYINRDDAFMQKVLVCIQTGTKIDDDNPLNFETDEFYLKTEEEMLSAIDNKEAIENTGKIADRCNVEFEFGKIKLPFFDTGGVDHFEFFKNKCYSGLKRIYGENPDDALKKRLDYELSVISTMGYVDYYLIVWDFVNYAKTNGIPVGPGRGSGAGSLAAYCMGITGIDPIKYNLLFERFLNPERVSMPDFDIDFCYVNRQKVIDYVIGKYGADHVAQIVTFGTMAARAAVRDVGRAMDLPYNVCDKVAKLIPMQLGVTLNAALQNVNELSALYNSDNTIKDLIDMAIKVEGMPRHASTHAAGVVICDRVVSDYVPLALNDEAVVTQYTMTALDELGLLKMDFLGLRNLTVIDDTVKEIQKINIDFDIEKIDENDLATLKMMGRGETQGVFQFESGGMKSVLRRLHPESIEDLIAVISLYRPGPMDSIDTYVHNRHNPQDITYATPLLEPILKVTYGCIVYQEQVMQICRSLAGYSLGRADIVRRAMSKKKHDVMKREKTAFIYGETDADGNVLCDGAIKRGVDEKTATEIFDRLIAFSSYAFNKSHAAAYATVAYRTAYLKCHYKKQYMAALLTSVLDNISKIAEYSEECKRLGIAVLPPDVNESAEGFCAEEKGIRFGLLGIKNIGRNLIENIIKNRKDGKYTGLYDFCLRNYSRDLNRRAVESLIKSGALDSLEKCRRSMLYALDGVLAAAEGRSRLISRGQMDLFGDSEEEDYSLPEVPEMPAFELLAAEKEATGMYLTGHPLSRFEGFIKNGNFTDIISINNKAVRDGAVVNVCGIIESVRVKQLKNKSVIAYTVLEDTTGRINLTVFSNAYGAYQPLLTVGKVVTVRAKISEREDRDTELLLETMSEVPESAQYEKPKKKFKSGVYLRVDGENTEQFKSAVEILSRHKGTYPVIIVCADSGKRLIAPDRLKVTVSKSLSGELTALLGEKNVKIV